MDYNKINENKEIQQDLNKNEKEDGEAQANFEEEDVEKFSDEGDESKISILKEKLEY